MKLKAGFIRELFLNSKHFILINIRSSAFSDVFDFGPLPIFGRSLNFYDVHNSVNNLFITCIFLKFILKILFV